MAPTNIKDKVTLSQNQLLTPLVPKERNKIFLIGFRQQMTFWELSIKQLFYKA